MFRLSSNDYKKERTQMEGDDEKVRLMQTYDRVIKIRKKYPTEAEGLKGKGYTEVRIVKDRTPSGEEIAFLTNLTGTEVPYTEISTLYFKRWNIEKSYNTLKNKLKIESVTGNASIYIYQDFWSQILVYNMAENVLLSANKRLGEEGLEKGYKNHIHANENMAMGLFKKEFIGIHAKVIMYKRFNIPPLVVYAKNPQSLPIGK